MKTYLQVVSQKHQTALAKLELPHFIETVFVHSWQATPRILKQSSVKYTLVMRGCRLYPRALRMIRGSGNKKIKHNKNILTTFSK